MLTRGIGDEGAGLLRGRRQSGEVVVEAAQERGGIGGGSGSELFFLKLRKDKTIDRIERPVPRRDGRLGRLHDGTEGPGSRAAA